MQIQELQESIKRIDSDYQGQIKIKEKKIEILKKEIEMLYEHINDIQRLGEIAFVEYGEKGIEQESNK